MRPLRNWIALQTADDVFESLFGLPVAEIDRITLFAPRAQQGVSEDNRSCLRRNLALRIEHLYKQGLSDEHPFFLSITTRYPYDQDAVLKTLNARKMDVDSLRGRRTYRIDEGKYASVSLLDDRSILLITRDY